MAGPLAYFRPASKTTWCSGRAGTVEVLVFVGNVSDGSVSGQRKVGNVGNGVVPAVVKTGTRRRWKSHNRITQHHWYQQSRRSGVMVAVRSGCHPVCPSGHRCADAGSTGLTSIATQSTGRAGQLTQNHGTEAAGNADEAVTVAPRCRRCRSQHRPRTGTRRSGRCPGLSAPNRERKSWWKRGWCCQVSSNSVWKLDDVEEGGVSDTEGTVTLD